MKLNIYVQPSAKKTEYTGFYNQNTIKIKVNAPPVDGSANKELIKFLSKKLKISKSSVKIINGEKGRNKLIEIPLEIELMELEKIFLS